MPKPYTVKSGDYLDKIAQQHGFSRWQDIYNHPVNQPFRVKRPDPNKIFPGDVLIIPDSPGAAGIPGKGGGTPGPTFAGMPLPGDTEVPRPPTVAMPLVKILHPLVHSLVFQQGDCAIVEVEGKPGLACYPYPAVTNVLGKDLGPMGNIIGKILPPSGKARWDFLFPDLPLGPAKFHFKMTVQKDETALTIVLFHTMRGTGKTTSGGGV